MWPLAVAAPVVNVIADAGRLILGLDLGSDGGGSIPTSLAKELPWNAFRPEAVSRHERVEAAREDALKAPQAEANGQRDVGLRLGPHYVGKRTMRGGERRGGGSARSGNNWRWLTFEAVCSVIRYRPQIHNDIGTIAHLVAKASLKSFGVACPSLASGRGRPSGFRPE